MLKSIYLVRLDKKGDKHMSKADILDKIEDIYEDSKTPDSGAFYYISSV